MTATALFLTFILLARTSPVIAAELAFPNCPAPVASPLESAETYAHSIDCPNIGTDPDNVGVSDLRYWMRRDPSGLGSTAEVIFWSGAGPRSAGNEVVPTRTDSLDEKVMDYFA